MKHHIEPIINQYFSCHQILLSTYASHQKRNYDMIFAESWGFGYQENDYTFGISLRPGCQNRSEFLLEKFHGIKIKYDQYTSKEILFDLFQSILPHSPIILFCDVFDCPWNISYRRNHIDHCILITGIDNKTKHLYVLDPYSTKDENMIEIDSIAQKNGRISSFVTMPLNRLQTEDYHLEIINSLNHVRDSNFFLNLESFRNDFQIKFEEVILSEYTDIYAVPLIINLRHIANQRYCYCLFLNKMIEQKLLDHSLLILMENIARKYGFLRISLIKQIMKKKNNNINSEIINEIANQEYEAYEKMKAFI